MVKNYEIFINYGWEWFREILGGQKKDWYPIFEHLSRVRTPLAHSNKDFLSESDKNLAVGYCHKILEVVSK